MVRSSDELRGNKFEFNTLDTLTGSEPDVQPVVQLSPLEQFGKGVPITRNSTAFNVGLKIQNEINKDEYTEIGSALLRLASGFQWCLGDWLLHGDNYKWGETYEQLAQRFGIAESTISAYKKTAEQIPFHIRNGKLSFSHHRLIKEIGKDLNTDISIETWINRAIERNWTVEDMRQAMLKTYPAAKKNTNTYTRLRQTFNDGIRDFRQAINSDKIDQAEATFAEMEDAFERMRIILEAAKPKE